MYNDYLEIRQNSKLGICLKVSSKWLLQKAIMIWNLNIMFCLFFIIIIF